MSAALAEVAAELGDGATLAAVAMAWALHKTPYVFPVIGGRKPEHLRANLEALSIALTDEHLKQLDGGVPLPPTFPYTLIVSASSYGMLASRSHSDRAHTCLQGDGSEPSHSIRNAAVIDVWPRQQAIRPQ